MDFFELVRYLSKKAKLFVLYWRRIIFAKDHFKVPLLTKLKANIFGGYLGDQWMLYDLDMKKRKEYLSEFDWYRSRYINEPFDYMLNNKIIATEVLGRYVRMPEIFLINSKGVISDFSGAVLEADEAVERVRGIGDAFIKPYGKGKGNGVHHITYSDGAFYKDDAPITAQDLAALFERHKDWYLSETVKQHPYADLLYDKTVNTIRIITLRDPKTKRFKVFFAVQRIGTSQTIPVDNGSQGGLVCNIDLETGRLSHGRRLHDREVYEVHPDSGTRFADVVIPDWAAFKEEILALAQRFPYLHFIAWDVIKMPDGKNCVIEANTSSGVNIVQLWGGQRHGELGDFYRAHGVIK